MDFYLQFCDEEGEGKESCGVLHRPHLQHPTRAAFAKLVYVIYIITEGTMQTNKNIIELNQPLGSINLTFFFIGLVWTILWAVCMDAVNGYLTWTLEPSELLLNHLTKESFCWQFIGMQL